MQDIKNLTTVLRSLVGLLEDEAANNPQFAAKLDAVLNGLPTPRKRARQPRLDPSTVPDVFAELAAKGKDEFRFWLRSLDLPTLKAIIVLNGFDPGKTSTRWKDPDKFVGLAFEQALGRAARGSAFLRPKAGSGGDNGIDLVVHHGPDQPVHCVQVKSSPQKKSQE
jgi:hypothetical protein